MTGMQTPAVRAAEPLEEPGKALHVARAFHRPHVAYLLAITLLGAALRLWHLADWSVWVDEAHTWRDVTSSLDSFMRSERLWYPLSFLGLRWLVDLGLLPQLSEGWLRLPFAFCGIVSVPLLAVFGNFLVGRRAALLAALFLAINPWHIYFSQNARGYVMVCFFATVAAGAYWLGLLRRSKPWRIAGVVCALAAGACHVTGLSLLPVFFAYPLLGHLQRGGRRVWLWVAVTGAIGILTPLLLSLLPPFAAFQKSKSEASFAHLVHTTAFYFRLPLLCAALTGVWMLLRTRMQGRVLFLACWVVVPLFVVGVVGSTVVKVTARYAFCALPAVMLLAAAASVRMAETLATGLGHGTLRSRLVPAAVLPVILCLDMVAYDYLYFTSQYGDRGRWSEVDRWVRRAAGTQPIELYSINEPSMLYYLRPSHYRDTAFDPHPGIRVWAIVGWEIDRGHPKVLQQTGGALPAGASKEGGAASYLHAIEADARQFNREPYFVVTLPELAEADRGGRLLALLRSECRLQLVLPCWVGPKDETIYVYQWLRR